MTGGLYQKGKNFLSVEDVETRPRCRAAMRARDGIKSNVAVGETFGMSASKRTIAVSTGGGDCPGLNAVIRAVVRTARLEYGWRAIGGTDGFKGTLWAA